MSSFRGVYVTGKITLHRGTSDRDPRKAEIVFDAEYLPYRENVWSFSRRLARFVRQGAKALS